MAIGWPDARTDQVHNRLPNRVPPTEAVLLHGDGFHSLLNLVSEPVEMFMKSIKHVALGWIGSQVADQRGLSGIPAKLFD